MLNKDTRTVEGFGAEWERFNQPDSIARELEGIFEDYFSIFPFDRLPAGARGFDMGCGSGRWARLVAPRVGKLLCVDASPKALEVARENLKSQSNCEFVLSSVSELQVPEASMDFGYSLGVLHHVPETFEGISSCVKKLKPGAPFLLYLYYRFDNRPFWFRMLWTLSNAFRGLISRLPLGLRHFVCDLIAAFCYFPVARIARLIEKLGGNVSQIPLSYYRDKSFYTMRTDALDRFGTFLEKRFTKVEIEQMMLRAGLERISFSPRAPFWCALGYRK